MIINPYFSLLAEGITEKAAKHNVASLALKELKIQSTNGSDSKFELDPTSSPFVPGTILIHSKVWYLGQPYALDR